MCTCGMEEPLGVYIYHVYIISSNMRGAESHYSAIGNPGKITKMCKEYYRYIRMKTYLALEWGSSRS